MQRYLISFDDGDMVIADEDLPDVARAANAVAEEAMAAGAWVFGGGLMGPDGASVVGTDGTLSDGPFPGKQTFIGGFAVIDAATRAEALEWAAKFAVACRCAQEVREFVPEPDM